MRVRLIVAVVLVLVGLLWIGQGLGFIGGSAMSNVGLFAALGAVLVVVGVALGLGLRRPRAGS